MLDISTIPLSADQARAARNYFGWPQAKVAADSGLPLHKLKRFETATGKSGTYIPDDEFLKDLRSFFERQGYVFDNTPAPGASAKNSGQVFPAGVVGDDGAKVEGSKNYRKGSAKVHHMRIAIEDEGEMGRTLDLIEANEERVAELLKAPIKSGIFAPVSEESQAQHAESVRLLAENGSLFARLFGRDVGGKPTAESLKAAKTKPTTARDLLHSLQADAHMAVAGDGDAKDRIKARKPAASLAQALGLS